MATELIPAGGLMLTGGSTDQKIPSAAILLQLSSATIQQLKSSSDGAQLVTGGQKPTLRYGDKSIELSLTPENHISDVFEFKAGNVLAYASSVSHRAQIRQPPKKEEDAEEAILALKNSMAQLEQEKKAQQIHVANGILPEPKNRWVAAKQQKKTGILLEAEERKHLTSAIRSPALAPTSQPADTSSRNRAMKKVVVHLVATKSMSMAEIAAKTSIPMQELKNLLPSIGQNVEGKWRLLDRAYKDLDIWRFKYSSKDERIMAQENAIPAYGRLRLGKDDQLWQKLLPVSERGQGKVLSRLHLNAGASSTPRPESPHADTFPASDVSARTTPSGTPTLGAHKKTNSDIMKRLLSKDPKKLRAAEDAKAKEKKRKEQSQDSEHESRAPKRQANAAAKKSSSTIKSAEFVYSSDDDQETSQVKPQVNGQQKKNSQTLGKTNGTPTDKKSTPKSQPKYTSSQSSNSAKTDKQPPKAQTRLAPSPRQSSPSKHNRPSVPSPLGASQPRNASDAPDRSAVKLARRAADHPKGLGISNGPLRRRHDTVTSIDSSEEASSNSSASMAKKSSDDGSEVKALKPGSKAREAANARAAKAIAENQARAKQSGQPSGNNSISSNGGNNGHHRTSSSDDRLDGGYSDSSISVIDTITFNQGVELAQKFQDDYYPQYAKIYDSISDRQARGVIVPIEETKKLWEMHERLKQMKREIEAASERQNRGGDS